MDTFATAETPHAVDHAQQPPPASVRLAYLLSVYPAVSHTFFLHEVLGLRARGLHIETASINPPDRPLADLPEDEAREAATTQYIKSPGRAATLLHLLSACVAHPVVLLRGLFAVLRLERLNLRARALWMFYLAEAMLVGRWMRQRRLHHLHVHFGGPVASVGMLTALAWRVPWSLTIHGPEELLNVDACHLREKIVSAAFVLCISDFCRSQLCQLAPPDRWDKFKVVRLGVDPLLLAPEPARHNNIPELLCIGRLVPAKGHRILLEALRLLTASGVPVRLTLVGAGSELGSLQRFAADHSLTHLITFTSSLSHGAALAHLRRADIFVLASFAEGIPVALMEAMSLGIACVSTTIAGIPELITSGVDGLLVPPSNAEALAEALQTLIADPAFRQQLGAAGRRKVLRDYNLPLNHALLAATFAQQTRRLEQRAAA